MRGTITCKNSCEYLSHDMFVSKHVMTHENFKPWWNNYTKMFKTSGFLAKNILWSQKVMDLHTCV